MQNIKLSLFIAIITAITCIFPLREVKAQCQPYIQVNGNPIYVNQNSASGLALPAWLSAGQTLAAGQMVNFISVIEFTENGAALEYSKVITVTTLDTVPAGKVWKIESIFKQPSFGSSAGVTYATPGTYNFTVPSCASYICIEVWGGGGGGGYKTTCCSGSGGGGGGGYGQECFTVTPGSSYTVTVGGGGAGSSGGDGGNGGTSSVGALITATGGAGSLGASTTGGDGGTSTAAVNVTGGTGATATATRGGKGGSGGNGGDGGDGAVYNTSNGQPGAVPGGGGGGGVNQGGTRYGGNGANGKVIITW